MKYEVLAIIGITSLINSIIFFTYTCYGMVAVYVYWVQFVTAVFHNNFLWDKYSDV